MPAPDRLLAFVLASFILIAIPGPAVLFTISRALAYGWRVALTTVVGGTAGSFMAATAVAIDIGTILQTSATVYTVIKLIGAGYLVSGHPGDSRTASVREAFEARAATVGAGRTLAQGGSSSA